MVELTGARFLSFARVLVERMVSVYFTSGRDGAVMIPSVAL